METPGSSTGDREGLEDDPVAPLRRTDAVDLTTSDDPLPTTEEDETFHDLATIKERFETTEREMREDILLARFKRLQELARKRRSPPLLPRPYVADFAQRYRTICLVGREHYGYRQALPRYRKA